MHDTENLKPNPDSMSFYLEGPLDASVRGSVKESLGHKVWIEVNQHTGSVYETLEVLLNLPVWVSAWGEVQKYVGDPPDEFQDE